MKARYTVVPMILFTCWLAGLAWYVSQVPNQEQTDTRFTDAVVVLTGGSERLKEGISLLEQNKAQKMLISGAGEGASLGSILASANSSSEKLNELQPKITVGHLATDTLSNALEAAIWLEFQGYHSIRLVTADYHIPRSLSAFRKEMPNIVIIPHPVFTGAGFWYTLLEYHKFILKGLEAFISG